MASVLRRFGLARAGGALAALVLLLLAPPPASVGPVAAWSFDTYQRLLPRQRDGYPVTLVAIDGESIARIGQWPWPRTRLAELVTRLAAMQPAVIGFDLVLAEADRTSPEEVAARLESTDADLAARLRALPTHDSVLAAALAQAPVVLGVGLAPDHASAPGRAPVAIETVGDVSGHIQQADGVLRNLPTLERAAAGLAALAGEPEAGIVRRLPVAVAAAAGGAGRPVAARLANSDVATGSAVVASAVNGDAAANAPGSEVAPTASQLWPGFAFEMLRVATGSPALRLNADDDGVRSVEVAERIVGTDADGRFWLHFAPPDARRVVAAADVLAGNVNVEAITGHLVLVGFTAQGTSDLVTTPLGDVRPGYEVHAEAIENVFDGRLLTRPRLAPWLELAAFVLLCVFVIGFVPQAAARHALPAFVLLVAAIAACGVVAFDTRGWLFDVASPVAAGSLVFLLVLGLSYIESERARVAMTALLARAREAQARTDGELEAARRIQLGMLPAADSVADTRVDIAALMLTARMVGGDLYDFFKLDADHLYVAVGDVSGKGVPASLFMAISKSIAHSHAARGVGDLDAVVAAAGAEIARTNPESLFVTLVATVLDLRSGALRYVNAGHETPMLHGVQGLRLLDAGGGPPLCVLDEYAYELATVTLAPGDMLLFVTDGITEALDARGALYGRERLQRVLAQPHADAAALVAAIRDDVLAFARGVDLPDDVAIVALRWQGG